MILVIAAIVFYIIAYAVGLAFFLYFTVLLISSIITHRYGAPFVPLEQDVVEAMLDLVDVKDGQLIIDLGSGDGRILLTAAERAKIKGVGYEISWYPLWLSKWKLRRSRHRDKITLERRNFFDVDLSQADVVTMYQTRAVQRKLVPKLKKELRKGTQIVVARYPLEDWIISGSDYSGTYPAYLYTV